MPQIQNIREQYQKGSSVAELSRTFGVDPKTIRKYVNQEDFSPKPPQKATKASILDPYKPRIDAWLAEDHGRWHKQRHTAKRIHDRLALEVPGYACSYNTVQRYVKRTIQEQHTVRASLELIWHPGESQADFGEADFLERGTMVRKKYLTLSFAYSNDSFTQVFGGENAECVCQGLKDIFAYIGGVPPLVVFDNATGVGRRIGEVIHEAELFSRMRAHYGFSVRFCNPNSGHEKGNVEAKIGYTRRNLFVPEPSFDDIEAYNRALLPLHAPKAEETHYKKLLPIKELFEEDKKALLPLSRSPFDPVRYEYLKTDGYGKVRIDSRHYYSTSPVYAGQEVLVAIRAHSIDILDDHKRLVVCHSRVYGEQRSDSCDYRTSLAVLMNNPGAWKNSGIREMVPDPLKALMDRQERMELHTTLKTMQRLSDEYGFKIAMEALEEGVQRSRTSFHDAAILAARIAGYGLHMTPERGQDLHVYDQFLEGAPV